MDLVNRFRRRVDGWRSAPGSGVPSSGSVADLERLFREHWPRAYRAALLVTRDAAAAEDIAQEAFLAAVRNLDRFDRRRPFAPWLHRIVVNRAIDWTRARRLRAEVELGDHRPGRLQPEPDGTALGTDRRSRRPSIAPSSSSATCSSTRRARSPSCSTSRAAPSTHGCAAASTG